MDACTAPFDTTSRLTDHSPLSAKCRQAAISALSSLVQSENAQDIFSKVSGICWTPENEDDLPTYFERYLTLAGWHIPAQAHDPAPELSARDHSTSPTVSISTADSQAEIASRLKAIEEAIRNQPSDGGQIPGQSQADDIAHGSENGTKDATPVTWREETWDERKTIAAIGATLGLFC